MLPEYSPCLLAFAFTALFVTFSNSFPSDKKGGIQFAAFGLITAAGGAYVVQSEPDTFLKLWNAFIALAPMTKFALTFVLIGLTYFGAAMYSIGLEDAPVVIDSKSEPKTTPTTVKKQVVNISPALTDDVVDFEVPSTLPESDKELFDMMFEK